MNTELKIGVVFLAGESWWESGICEAREGKFAGFIDTIEHDVASIVKELSRDYQVITSGLIHSLESARAEARRFNAEDIDAVLFCPIIWTNDPPVIAFLETVKSVPLLLWAYNPYQAFPKYFKLEEWLRASSPVSVQQSAAIFHRYGRHYSVVFGHHQDPDVKKRIGNFCRAVAVRKSLRETKIAVIPSPCRVVVSTWYDEMFIRNTFGVEIEYLTVETFAEYVRSVSQSRVEEYVSYITDNFPVMDVDSDMLEESARQALAFVELIKEHNLSGIALEDFNEDIYNILGFRPHLLHPDFGTLGCTIGLEADVLNVLSTIVAGRLAGGVGMFNEFFTINREENTILMGHPGHGEMSMGASDTFVVTPDLEFDETEKRGAWLSYRARPGYMSFLNFTPAPGSVKVSLFTGESLPGVRLMEGYSHMLIKASVDVNTLFTQIVEDGLIQHWGTTYGDITEQLSLFTSMCGLSLTCYS
jgi:L-arabinose isomerase